MPALRKTITAAHVQNAKGGTRKGEEPAGCRRYESGTAALKDGGYTVQWKGGNPTFKLRRWGTRKSEEPAGCRRYAYGKFVGR